MRTLHVRLMGDFQMVYGDEAVSTIYTPRPQSVLAYLLLHRQAPQARLHPGEKLLAERAPYDGRALERSSLRCSV